MANRVYFSMSIFLICLGQVVFWLLPLLSLPVDVSEAIELGKSGFYEKFVDDLKYTQPTLDTHGSFFLDASYLQKVQSEMEKWMEPAQELPQTNVGARSSSLSSSAMLSSGLLVMTCMYARNSMSASRTDSVPKSGSKKRRSISTTSTRGKTGSMTSKMAAKQQQRNVLVKNSLTQQQQQPLTTQLIQNHPNLLFQALRQFSSSRNLIGVPQMAAPSATVVKADTLEALAQNISQQFSVPATDLPPLVKTSPKSDKERYQEMTDDELLDMVSVGSIQEYALENTLGDLERAVKIRRKMLERKANLSPAVLANLPYTNYAYEKVAGQCCENVLGYVPIPVGIVGPLKINDQSFFVPLATTEGALVASTQRGTKAINESGGMRAAVLSDGMTRAPLIRFPSLVQAAQLKEWVEDPTNYAMLVEKFQSSSKFAKLKEIKVMLAGRNVYLRFKCTTGDAMGMNMVSKGVETTLNILGEKFEGMQVMSLSGNLCTDKKPSAVNWIEGRGKSVVCEATIKGDVVQRILKTTVKDLVDLNTNKNLVGSIMAGSIGGFNAHASNLVTAVFLATGQDAAQNVESSNCLTLMESANDGQDLYMSVTMPSVEVGTVGGGTGLPAQSACLDIMGLKGASKEPGQKPKLLATAVCGAVLAGELSLMSALAAGHLVQSHLKLNRAAPKKH